MVGANWNIGVTLGDANDYVGVPDESLIEGGKNYCVHVYFASKLPADLSQRIYDANFSMIGQWFDGFRVMWVSYISNGSTILEVHFSTASDIGGGWTVGSLKSMYMTHPLFEGHPVNSVVVFRIGNGGNDNGGTGGFGVLPMLIVAIIAFLFVASVLGGKKK